MHNEIEAWRRMKSKDRRWRFGFRGMPSGERSGTAVAGCGRGGVARPCRLPGGLAMGCVSPEERNNKTIKAC
jgi:hypothetical protein